MGDQELFIELKKINLLLRYDGSKLATTRTILQFNIGKSQISKSENYLLFGSSPPILDLETPFFGYEKVLGSQKTCWKQIFEFFIFWDFFGHFMVKNHDFCHFSSQNGQKIRKHENFKNLFPTSLAS